VKTDSFRVRKSIEMVLINLTHCTLKDHKFGGALYVAVSLVKGFGCDLESCSLQSLTLFQRIGFNVAPQLLLLRSFAVKFRIAAG
jgi:hypothetical protein